MQLDAGDEDCRYRDDGHVLVALWQHEIEHGPLVSTEQLLDATQRDRIDVPGVARDVDDPLHRAVTRGVKPVVEARFQAQRHEHTVAIAFDEFGVAEQVLKLVGEALGLEYLGPAHVPMCPDDCIARAGQHFGIRIDRAHAGAQFADETLVQAAEPGCFGLGQVQVRRKQAPQANGDPGQRARRQLAEPAHEPRRQPPRDPVGDEEVQVFLQEDPGEPRSPWDRSLDGEDFGFGRWHRARWHQAAWAEGKMPRH
jgi:hypothetical protein